jgi:hypothetical protein
MLPLGEGALPEDEVDGAHPATHMSPKASDSDKNGADAMLIFLRG